MPLLIVPGVCRFAINQRQELRQVVNIVDMIIDTTGSLISRDEAIDNQAGILINEWTEHIQPAQADDLSFESVSYVDLDSSAGITGSRTSSGAITLPQPGGASGDTVTANTAALVRKQLESSGRGRRNGRLYMAGLTEGVTEPGNGNVLTSVARADLQSRWTNFLAAINQADSGGDFGSNWCVVQVTSRDADGHPLTGIGREIGGVSVDFLLATQRRRLRG